MKSIKQVTITNFQSHANTTVEFSPAGNLTVVTGDSDSGKTSILRALRWLFYNQPQGTEFIRVGCSSAKVTATTDDGWSVTRLRTPSKNQYIITHPSGDEQVYEGFGNNMPSAVWQVLGVAPAYVGDMDLKLNIAEQLDGPFLGNSIAASFRAKVLGKLAGTEDVDVANKQLGTDIYRGDQDLKSVKSQLSTKVEQIKDLAWVEDLGKVIGQLEVLAQEIKNKQEQVKVLRGLYARRTELSGSIDKGKVYLSRYQGLDVAQTALNNAATMEQQRTVLVRLQRQHIHMVLYTRHLQDKLQPFQNVYAADNRIIDADGFMQRLNTLETLSSKYIVASNTLAICKERVGATQGAEQANELIGQAKSLWDTVSKLMIVKGKHHTFNKNYSAMYNINARLGGVQSATDKLSGTTGTITKINRLRQVQSALSESKQSKEKTLGTLELAKHTLENATKLYGKVLQEAGICPTCGAKVHEFKHTDAPVA